MAPNGEVGSRRRGIFGLTRDVLYDGADSALLYIIYLASLAAGLFYFDVIYAFFAHGEIRFATSFPDPYGALLDDMALWFLSIPVAFFALTTTMNMTSGIARTFDNFINSITSRRLTDEQNSLADEIKLAMLDYLTKSKGSLTTGGAALARVVLAIIIVAPFGVVLALSEGLGSSIVRGFATRGEDIFIYRDSYGFADGVMVVVAYYFFNTLWTAFENRSRTVAAKSVADMLSDFEDPIAALTEMGFDIDEQVRSGRITDKASFDPAQTLHELNRSVVRSGAGVTMFALAFALTALYLDRSDHTLITDEFVQVAKYFPPAKQRIEFSDLQSIELVCTARDNGRPIVRYQFQTIEHGIVTVVAFSTALAVRTEAPGLIDHWRRIDAKARSVGIPVKPSVSQSYDRVRCEAALNTAIGPVLTSEVMEIIRTDG
jgi:hypothetical protein